ncbi:MAG: Txe/YoeB family addiction module toxin [Bacteroidetes bacterium]|nr:Txe/YoeB family addiction module toxin [Bacteroidota bacterium]
MKIEFQPPFLKDLEWWIRTDRPTALRVLKLVEAVRRDPFHGMGKPEPLKNIGSGYWSRRITLEDRLVYFVDKEQVTFLQAQFHY